MVALGWHSVVASVVLAAFHGLNIALLYWIAWTLFEHRPPRERHVLCFLAAALGAASAVFAATVGSSFLEPLLSVPMLAGLLLLLAGDDASVVRRGLFAGLLFGAAAALKYSNAIFALAALPLAFIAGRNATATWRGAIAYCSGGVLATAALAGPWMVTVGRELGNPLFPFMNGWFRSPHAPAVNMAAGRFAIESIGAALAFPIDLVTPDRMLYAEITAPDLRFAALLLAALALPVVAFLRRQGAHAAALRGADWRLLGFFAASYVLWLATSANGRYGLVVLLLAGVCLVRLAERVLPLGAARIALVVLLVAQVAACFMVSAPRWFIADRWSRQWLPFVPAERALREPALYLTVETLPMAAVVPFVNPDSSFVNLRGQYSVPPRAPRLEALFARHQGHVRALGRYLQLRDDGRPRVEVVDAYDSTFIRYGYRIDDSDCFAIDWRPDDDDVLSTAANWLARQPESHAAALSLGSCALRPARRDPLEVEAERQATVAFDRIERACPALFRGQTGLTESLGSEWMRNYPALDARLETQGGNVIFDRYLVLRYFHFGSLAAWQRGEGSLPEACR
jgi:hypothetical protein